MLATEMILHEQWHRLIADARRILLVAHKKPDGDTLGATGAILQYLMREGKQVTAFCADPVPESYRYLPNWQQFTSNPAAWQEPYDLICVFDAGDLRYAGVADFYASMPTKPPVVNIDHHATNERFGAMNLLFTDASSTAEVVFRFLESRNIFIDGHMATCLLTGIVFDTSNFINPATNAVCIRAASHLLICGARVSDIMSSLIRNKTVPALQLWGRALERIRENPALGIASTIVTLEDMRETGVEGSDAVEGIANFLTAVLNVPVVMVLREMPDGYVKGSLRSSTKDVAAVAKLLGGGGHKKAAGFTVKGELEERDGIWQVKPAAEALSA
ncbi:MAG: DHH family phosphoesterase [bacterium]|nr:DHH family phosphoesterase [bacterium]